MQSHSGHQQVCLYHYHLLIPGKFAASYINPNGNRHSHSKGYEEQYGCCNQLSNRPKANTTKKGE